MSRLIRCLALSTSVLILGCGPSMNEVKGTVTSDGKAVPDVQVVFVGQNGESALARTDANGAYAITTPAGKYSVSVTLPPDKMPARDPNDPYKPVAVKYPFPQKYVAAGTSGLTHEVTGSGTYDLKLD